MCLPRWTLIEALRRDVRRLEADCTRKAEAITVLADEAARLRGQLRETLERLNAPRP